jgi:transcription elongation factor S-II
MEKVETKTSLHNYDEDLSIEFFANELEEQFATSQPILTQSSVSSDVLLCGDLCREILSYLPTSELLNFGKISSEFHRQTIALCRRSSHRLLVHAGLLKGAFIKGVKSPAGYAIGCGDGTAAQVENEVYRAASVGRVCLPSRYSEKLRSLLYNLRSNSELCGRVEAGELSPQDLVSMSADEMLSNDVRSERKRLREKAIEESKKPLLAADIVGLFSCPNCSSDRQWIRRHTLSGMVDRYSETLVCCDCRTHVSATSNRIEISNQNKRMRDDEPK